MRVVDRWDEVEALLTDCRSLELPANPQRLLQRIDDEQAKLAATQTEAVSVSATCVRASRQWRRGARSLVHADELCVNRRTTEVQLICGHHTDTKSHCQLSRARRSVKALI